MNENCEKFAQEFQNHNLKNEMMSFEIVIGKKIESENQLIKVFATLIDFCLVYLIIVLHQSRDLI